MLFKRQSLALLAESTHPLSALASFICIDVPARLLISTADAELQNLGGPCALCVMAPPPPFLEYVLGRLALT